MHNKIKQNCYYKEINEIKKFTVSCVVFTMWKPVEVVGMILNLELNKIFWGTITSNTKF